jgi:hypothetical protein
MGGHGQTHKSGASKTMVIKGCVESEDDFNTPSSVAAQSKQPLESNPAFRVHSFAAKLSTPKKLSN